MENFFEWVLAILDFVVPKDKKIIAFGANEMRGINGNVAAIIKAWKNNTQTKKFKSYVISVHKEKFSGCETIDPRSLRGVMILLRSYTAVVSHLFKGGCDIYWYALYNRKRRRILNLWHGSPLKRIGPRDDWDKTGIFIASSKIERLAISSCTGLPLNRVIVTGYPKIDRVIKSPKKLKVEALSKLNKKDLKQKFILYSPTFRRDNKIEGYLHRRKDFSFRELKKLLEKNNAYLLVRSHINDPFSDFPTSERIIHVNYINFPDIEPLYALADLLITDYSSTIIEYLTLNRPIVSFAPDIEEYGKSPGLLYDYEAIFPGPIAKDWKTLQKFISEALENPFKYASLREDRRRLFNEKNDGKATERVIDLICDMSVR